MTQTKPLTMRAARRLHRDRYTVLDDLVDDKGRVTGHRRVRLTGYISFRRWLRIEHHRSPLASPKLRRIIETIHH